MAAIAADRNLLVGQLALQGGVIDQGQLVAAFQAWTRDKLRPLADHLVGRGDLNAEDRSAVEALVLRHITKHGGDAEKSLAAIPAGRSTREGLAKLGDPVIGATLGHVGSGYGSTENGDADRTASYAVGSATSDGQRFRVLRPHAKGGLGAVFVALDTELHREVALKQILDQHADDPISRQRFLLEAEVTGGLEQPGIVPVYGLGTQGDGRPYYAMRFVRGDSLKEAIEQYHGDARLEGDRGRRSLDLRNLLRRFTDVCNAIEYAHGRGVLHRDIKPSNVIVGKHGETLVVDWGLAKATGQTDPAADEQALMPSSASGSASTLPGSAMGTPAYMSPEQSVGDLEHLGPRSDVYSLGATLYCLLSGEPPFEGHLADMIHAVQKGQFPPPRQLEPSIDRALEAVCLKAMALKPGDRYGSPKALADDVERWLADEPVTAWREPWTRSMIRWLTRHRVGVTAAGAAMLVALVGTLAVLGVQTRANTALKAANTELASASTKVTQSNADLAAANQRERARLALAQEAIRTFHTGVSEDILLRQEEFKALRTKLLGEAREFYRKLEGLLQGHEDRDSRLALGRAYHEVGRLSEDIDSLEAALQVQRRAAALFEGLARESPDDAESRAGLARCLESLVRIFAGTGRSVECVEAVERARDVYRALAEADPTDLRRRGDWARAELHYGDTVWLDQHRSREGMESIQRARAILEDLVRAEPSERQFGEDLATTYGVLAPRLVDAGRREEALAAWGGAIAQLEAMFRASPGDPAIGHELSRNLGNMALQLAQVGRRAEALKAEDRAREVLTAVGHANPTLRRVTADRAWLDLNSGINLAKLGRDNEALAALERAREAREALARANPTVPRFQAQLAWIHREVGKLHRRAGRIAEALASYERSGQIATTMAAAFPNDREAQGEAANSYVDLTEFLDATGKPSDALAWHGEAITLARRAVEADPSSSGPRAALAQVFLRRGITLRKCGRPAEAVSDFRQSTAVLRDLMKPGPWDYYNMACAQSLLSGVAAEPGSRLTAGDGQGAADAAMTTLHRAAAAGWRDAAFLAADTDLVPIRSRPDFQAHKLDMEFPDEPFASSDPMTGPASSARAQPER
jgi:serine/threonine-protein kinase